MKQTESYEIAGDNYKITMRFNKDGELNGSEFTVKGSTLDEVQGRITECEQLIARRMT